MEEKQNPSKELFEKTEEIVLDKTELNDISELIAFDTKSGKVIYRVETKGYSWSSPIAFYNEKNEMFIFTGDVYGDVYLFRGKTGELLHTSHVGNNFESSPIAIDNKVICGSRGTQIYKMSIE